MAVHFRISTQYYQVHLWRNKNVHKTNRKKDIAWARKIVRASLLLRYTVYTNGFVNVHILNRRIKGMKWSKNYKTSPINLAVTSGNGNVEFYNYMESTCSLFKLEITLDRHNARLKLNYWLLSDPPHFRYYLPLRGFGGYVLYIWTSSLT